GVQDCEWKEKGRARGVSRGAAESLLALRRQRRHCEARLRGHADDPRPQRLDLADPGGRSCATMSRDCAQRYERHRLRAKAMGARRTCRSHAPLVHIPEAKLLSPETRSLEPPEARSHLEPGAWSPHCPPSHRFAPTPPGECSTALGAPSVPPVATSPHRPSRSWPTHSSARAPNTSASRSAAPGAATATPP